MEVFLAAVSVVAAEARSSFRCYRFRTTQQFSLTLYATRVLLHRVLRAEANFTDSLTSFLPGPVR